MSRKNNPNPNNKPTRVPINDSGIAQDSAIINRRPRNYIGYINENNVSPVQKMTNPSPPPKKK